ncbi:MAG: PEGA domain-containing protein [bacterium]
MFNLQNKKNRYLLIFFILNFSFFILFYLIKNSVYSQDNYQNDNNDNNDNNLKATIVVNTIPTNCSVYVDNVFIGNTPLRKEISPGQHLIRISYDDNYVSEFIKLIAFAKHTYKYDIKLKYTSIGAYRKAQNYLQEQNYLYAREYFLLSTKSYGKLIPEAYFYAGYISFILKEFDKTEKYLLNYISYNSYSLSSWFMLGESRKTLNKISLAIASYKEALKIVYPKINNIFNSVYVTYDEQKKLEKEIVKNPTLDNYIKLARIYELKGDLNSALYYYRKALMLFNIEISNPYIKKSEIDEYINEYQEK